ncbi:MAG: hypothetical protein KF764_09485 [Labilithrix sp.]|nr:hypothetical protein [Labilithrix sp.]
MRITTGSILVVTAGAVITLASCADSSDEEAPTDNPSTLLDGGASDGAALDAACEGGADDCPTTPPCKATDLCPVATGADPRHALMSVWGSSKNDVWAVGSRGTIVHWDGMAWASTPSGTTQTLFAVSGTGAGDVWAVSSRAVALHSTGFTGATATWTASAPVAPAYAPYFPMPWNESLLLSVLARAPGDVWIGGEPYPVLLDPDSPPQKANLWRGSGMSWHHDVLADDFAIRGFWASGAADVWAVGGVFGTPVNRAGRAFHTTGPSGAPVWTEVDTQSSASLSAVWGSGPNDVWIVGDRGTVRHWTNGPVKRWEIVAVPTDRDLHAVWGSGANDLWVVGDFGTVLRYDGVEWRAADAVFPVGVTPHLRGVWGSAADDVWVVGDGIALHLSPKAGTAP